MALKIAWKKEFEFLKEATSRNIENFQTSLNLQQTYSSSLCAHVNNIYTKLSELQRQIQKHPMHTNPEDTVQIEAPDFNPDIDEVSSPSTDEKHNELQTQGTPTPASEVTEPKDNNSAPAITSQQSPSQETDWLDAILVEIPTQAQYTSDSFEIPDLEENSEEEQFANLDSYLAHHNTYEASQHICQEYQSRLHALDDDQYYAEVNQMFYSHKTLAAQDYQLANQSAEPHRTTEELKRIFGKGRGQAKREELHGHRPFGPRTHSLQSRIQHKIKKNQ